MEYRLHSQTIEPVFRLFHMHILFLLLSEAFWTLKEALWHFRVPLDQVRREEVKQK